KKRMLLSGRAIAVIAASFFFAAPASAARITPDMEKFIREVSKEYGLEPDSVRRLLKKAEIQPAIIRAITKPAETITWTRYRTLFMTPERIGGGVEFWRENAEALELASKRFGVPPEIIVATIGVETRYGRNTGNYRVLDALATLGFEFPARGAFFRGELAQFLLMVDEANLDPMRVTGSYAGAMGIPQFIPSSFRRWAIDFDEDGKIDFWNSAADAIGSVAYYYYSFGWEAGAPVVERAEIFGAAALPVANAPDKTLAELQEFGISSEAQLDCDTKAFLVSLDVENGFEHWLGFNNFYVITRYNRSPKYAMAVYQLSQAIRVQAAERANPNAPPAWE
ncbi:MAG: lytic murein transglycosylase B, partial [Burkholderiales bacterium]